MLFWGTGSSLRSPQVYSSQTRDSGEPVCSSTWNLEALELTVRLLSESWQMRDPRRTDISVWVWGMEKTNAKAVRQKEFPLNFRGAGRMLWWWWCGVSLFVLFRYLLDWMGPTHIREHNVLSPWIQMAISSRNTFIDTSRIMFKQISVYSMAQASWWIKLTVTPRSPTANQLNHFY